MKLPVGLIVFVILVFTEEDRQVRAKVRDRSYAKISALMHRDTRFLPHQICEQTYIAYLIYETAVCL